MGEIQLAFEVSAFAGWSSASGSSAAIELAPLANEIRNGVEELQRNTQRTIELPEHARIKFKIEPAQNPAEVTPSWSGISHIAGVTISERCIRCRRCS